jgi:arginase family enzyme
VAKALEIDEKVFAKALLSFYEPEAYTLVFGGDHSVSQASSGPKARAFGEAEPSGRVPCESF